MKKALILGDSNTWGYDPRGYFEYIKLDRDKSTFKSHRDFSSEIEITFKHF